MDENQLPRGLSMLGNELAAYQARLASVPEDDADDKDEDARKDELVEMAIKRFQLAATAEAQQRAREDEDLQFDRALPEDQWPAEIRQARSGGIGPDGFQVSQRPCLVINKLDQPVQQVINEARNARLGIQIRPKADGANQEGAEIRQGLIRSIEMDSRAQIARLWALDRAVKCGRGAYRIAKQYANDGDFDIDLVVDRILNQASVYLDPFAQQPDWSDGEWALLTNDIPMDEYKRRYPDSDMATASADQLSSVGNRVPGWIGGSEVDGTLSIRVAEYYYVEHETRTLVFTPEGGKQFLDELPEGIELLPTAKMRDVDIRTVKWCVINAEEVLEEEDWEGRYIPIIPVIGKEYNVNGDRCFKGVISNSKDAQRSYNYMRSAQVEAVGLAPKAPWIMAEGQDEGYEAMWDQSNTRNYTRLKYKPVDFMGKSVSPPSRNVAEPAIQAISMAVSMADQDIKSTTGRFDASLGKQRSDQSGKAILALKESGESSTSNYLENLTSVSMHYEAKVLLDLMPFIYDRPGRIIRVLGEEENDDQTVMINQPFVESPNGPQPAPPPGMMERLGQAMGRPPKHNPKFYDLTKGTYGIEVTVGRTFATQRDENADMLRSLIQAAPGLTPLVADLMVEQLDTPIAKRVAKRLRAMNPQLAKEGEDSEIPPQVQAQLQAMEQQQQQLTQALQEATEEIKTQRYKIDKEYDARMQEVGARIRVAEIQAQSTIGATTLKTQTDEEIAMAELEAKSLFQQQELSQERELTIAGQRHAKEIKVGDAVAKRADAIATREHDTRMRVGDAMAQRMGQRADHDRDRELQRTDQQHALKKDAFADARARLEAIDRRQQERADAEAKRNAAAKTATTTPEVKKP